VELAGPSALDLVARRAFEQLAALPDVLRAGFAVSEGGRRQLLFTATDRGDESGAFEWCRIDAAWEVPLNCAARDGELVAGTLDELEDRFRSFVADQRDTPVRFVAAVPVSHDGEHLGGFVLYCEHPQPADLDAHLGRVGRSIGADLVDARRDRHGRTPVGDDGASRGSGGTRRASHDMPGEPHAIGDARRFLHATLAGWGLGPALVDDAVLCLDELATNALVHTHGGCRVTVGLVDGVLRVQVVDFGGLGPIRLAPTPQETAGHGRGLRIVEALASRTGRDAAECLAWFEIDVTDGPASART
jgi:anti-sigma regulatory factor (Ser/Thr protein kinase)